MRLSISAFIFLALAGCARSDHVGAAAGYPPGAFAEDGRPIWHRCLKVGGVATSACSTAPVPDGYVER